jgi:hypothetical protein
MTVLFFNQRPASWLPALGVEGVLFFEQKPVDFRHHREKRVSHHKQKRASKFGDSIVFTMLWFFATGSAIRVAADFLLYLSQLVAVHAAGV